MKRRLSMKRLFVIFFVFSLISTHISLGQINKEEIKETITMSGAWALYPMAIKWAEEYQKIYPNIKIDIQAGGAGKGMVDVLSGMVDIGNVSRDIYPPEIEKGAFAIAVTRDAVVPTINENNPFLTELLRKGLKRETFISIWITGTIKNWNEIVNTEKKAPLHVYTRSDACGAAKTWAKYLKKNQEDLIGIGVYGDPGVAEAVRRDPFGIGFNNINYAYDAKTKKPVKGIKIVPVDLNGNGQIDKNEDFFRTREDIISAIRKDIYPSPPARDLYFVTKGKPKNKVIVEFIKWILSEGQKYVSETGYIPLPKEKLEEGLEKIEKN